jgi:16S rRNA G1207 methylase RsmC
MPTPAPIASTAYDSWFKTTLRHSALGRALNLRVPHDVFSTQQIDEGTLLLLKHLPAREPSSVLDMGCGYGALSLPIAARYPAAKLELVDRDLLAVKWAAQNARENGLAGVEAYGSLGYRDLKAPGNYDWILCNVPARIGRPFIEDLLGSGRRRLKAEGELRVVVINDLVPMLQEIEKARQWSLTEIARGPRHSIYSIPASQTGAEVSDNPDLYLRDPVEIEGLKLDRPFDLGGDDPKRLRAGLPALVDALPRTFAGRAFCFRAGYGQIPLVMRARCPGARIVAVDRDLLATTYTRRNAERLGLASDALEVRECATMPDAIARGERFDLILGELSPSAGAAVAEAEIKAAAQALNPGGQALLLTLEKLDQQWVRPFVKRSGLSLHPVLMREGYAVLSLRS